MFAGEDGAVPLPSESTLLVFSAGAPPVSSVSSVRSLLGSPALVLPVATPSLSLAILALEFSTGAALSLSWSTTTPLFLIRKS